MSAIKVAIADDEPFVRAALRQFLALSADFLVAGEAEDGLQALELVRAAPPDVLLLDLSMPRAGGLDVLGQIRSVAPSVAVVVLSGHAPAPAERQGLQVSAWLDKACGPDEIARTVRAAAAARHAGAAADHRPLASHGA